MKIRQTSHRHQADTSNNDSSVDEAKTAHEPTPWDPDEEPTTIEFEPMKELAKEIDFLENESDRHQALSLEEITKTNEQHEELTRKSELPDLTFDSSAVRSEEDIFGSPSEEFEDGTTDSIKNIQDYLDEIDFYIMQNLFTDAKEIIMTASEKQPGSPQLAARLAIVEGSLQAAARDVALNRDPLELELDSSTETDEGETSKLGREELRLLRSMVETEQNTVDKKIRKPEKSSEESDAHCDLGLNLWQAKELDEAIRQFNLAMDVKKNRVFCHMMIGVCYRDKQHKTTAIKHFKYGLHEDKITHEEAIALYYELGLTYELLKDTEEALYYYSKVERHNSNFRDIGARIATLNGTSNSQVSASPNESMAPTETENAPWTVPSAQRGYEVEHSATIELDVDSLNLQSLVLGSDPDKATDNPHPTGHETEHSTSEKPEVDSLDLESLVLGNDPDEAADSPTLEGYETEHSSTIELDVDGLDMESLISGKEPGEAADNPTLEGYETEHSSTIELDVDGLDMESLISGKEPPPFKGAPASKGYETENSPTEDLDVDSLDLVSVPPPFKGAPASKGYEMDSGPTEILDMDSLDLVSFHAERMKNQSLSQETSGKNGGEKPDSDGDILAPESPATKDPEDGPMDAEKQENDIPETETPDEDQPEAEKLETKKFEPVEKPTGSLVRQSNIGILQKLHHYKKS